MAESSAAYHEPYDLLSGESRDTHRALTSIQEELEAIDWYQQRAEVAGDGELKEILLHNRSEEMEHACMLLEWLRRRSPDLAERARTYLFTEGSITAIEAAAQAGKGAGGAPAVPAAAGGTLGIGSLKGTV